MKPKSSEFACTNSLADGLVTKHEFTLWHSDKNTNQEELFVWALLRCFYSPSFPATLPLLFSLYLWAVKWGGQRRGRRENNCRRKRSIIELSSDPALRQACVGLGGRANRMCRNDTHTHAQTLRHTTTNGLFLFISPLQGLRQIPLISEGHVWLLSSLTVIAPASI